MRARISWNKTDPAWVKKQKEKYLNVEGIQECGKALESVTVGLNGVWKSITGMETFLYNEIPQSISVNFNKT